MLLTYLATGSFHTISLDILDECLPKYRPELLSSPRNIVQEPMRTKILFTGRPHIREDVQRYFYKAVAISIRPSADNIRSYVAMNKDLQEDITKAIMGNMSDM